MVHGARPKAVVVVILRGGIPPCMIDRAFEELQGFRRVSARGILWSNAVCTHASPDQSLSYFMSCGGDGGMLGSFEKAGYTTVVLGVPRRARGSSKDEVPFSLAADVHDCVTGFHAVKRILAHDFGTTPLALVVGLKTGTEPLLEERLRDAPRAFSVEAEAERLPPTVHGDDCRRAVAASHRAGSLAREAAAADASRGETSDASWTAGERAARMHTVAWRAMERADGVLQTLEQALEQALDRVGGTLQLVIVGDGAIATGEHGVFGTGAPYVACTRTFAAVETGCAPYREVHPVSTSVVATAILDLLGVGSGGSGTDAAAWDPSVGAPLTVRRAHDIGDAPGSFVRCVLTHDGRTYAWTVWLTEMVFGLRFRTFLGNLHLEPLDQDREDREDCEEREVREDRDLVRSVCFAVYDLSSDPHELDELSNRAGWRATPLADALWVQVRRRMTSVPELLLQHAPPPPPCKPRSKTSVSTRQSAAPVSVPASARTPAARTPAARAPAARAPAAPASAPMVVQPTKDAVVALEALTTRAVAPGSQSDASSDSWKSGPVSPNRLSQV